jgi:hypothetical protein
MVFVVQKIPHAHTMAPRNLDLDTPGHVIGFILMRLIWYGSWIAVVAGFLSIFRFIRSRQERRKDLGDKVYLTAYSHYRRLRHQCLVVRGVKYEVRQDRETKRYYWKPTPAYDMSNHDDEMLVHPWFEGIIQRYIPWLRMPKIIPLWNSRLVGWTTISDEEILRACGETWNENPDYSLLSNNCQHFARRVADKIIPPDHRATYTFWWFRDGKGELASIPIVRQRNFCWSAIYLLFPCMACF